MPVMNKTTIGKREVKVTPLERVEKKLKAAGCKNFGWYRGAVIMDDQGAKDKTINMGINGQIFTLKMGEVCDIPEPLYAILENAHMVKGGAYEPPKKEAEKTEPAKAE